ncbi:MAG: PAS domain S-box protein [Candidatus Riflebacteria bacterium]|nr:PAS domain S-box protein [Candidatus Riflebacteria bacterium]
MPRSQSREDLEKQISDLKSQIESLNRVYRSVVDNSLDAILLTVPDGQILAANKAATLLFQMSEQEIISGGRNAVVDITDPRLAPGLEKRRITGSVFGELNFKKADGTVFPAEVSTSIFTDSSGQQLTSMIIRDISERKKAENELKHSEELLRYIIDNVQSSVAVFDREMRYIYVSRRYLKEYDIEEKNVIGKCHYELFPNLPQRLCEAHQRAMAGETVSNDRDFLIQNDGSKIWGSWTCLPWYEVNGSIGGIVLYAEAITDRVNAEEALRQSEDNYRTLFQQMLNGFAQHEIICDDSGKPVDYRFLAINPAFERLTGLKADTIIGRTVREIMPDLDQQWIETYGQVALTGQAKFFENYSTPLGKYYEVTAFCPKPGQFACIFNDVSERKISEQEKEKLQEQLLHSQKLESVGRLAGGVAHDFNNMLGVILGHAELMEKSLGTDVILHNDLAQIIGAAKRSANLTRQLLAFARKQAIKPEIIDINVSITNMLQMLRRLIGENIELVWLPRACLCPVCADSSHLDQVMTNLCVNARDAIKNVGKITITTDMKTFTADCRDRPTDIADGDYVVIMVSDNGCGMNREVLSHIFEPFYTTKQQGEGTGLGLATVYGIVKQNHGFIEVDSAPEKGTTMTIFLPKHNVKTSEITTKSSDDNERKTGNETILLVEDEPALLKMTAKILTNLGYKVLTASTPGEARKILASGGEKIALLLTDLIMPEMNGKDLALELKKLQPNLKVIFMSGYTADIIADQEMLNRNLAFIEKPFTQQRLAEIVRESLEKGQQG